MGGFQAIGAGLAGAGSDFGRAAQLVQQWRQMQLQDQLEKIRTTLAQQQVGMEQERIGLERTSQQRLQQEFELRRKQAMQPQFLGFQKVGSKVYYGLQSPDGQVTVKEAEGMGQGNEVESIESAINSLPPGVGQQAARAAVTPYIVAGDYTGAMTALKPYLLQYGKSGLPGSVTETDTQATVTINTPQGPRIVQIPKHTITRRGVGIGQQPPSAQPVATTKGQGKPAAISKAAALGLPPGAKDIGPTKPTGPEQTRADLAENMNENMDQLEDIVKRRPELFGKGRGLITQIRGFTGTSDPDVASLKAIHDFLGRASQGAHGMRAARGVAEAADALMAGYRNDPRAMLAVIRRARASIKTFQLDAQRGVAGATDTRDDTYQKLLDKALGPDANAPR